MDLPPKPPPLEPKVEALDWPKPEDCPNGEEDCPKALLLEVGGAPNTEGEDVGLLPNVLCPKKEDASVFAALPNGDVGAAPKGEDPNALALLFCPNGLDVEVPNGLAGLESPNTEPDSANTFPPAAGVCCPNTLPCANTLVAGVEDFPNMLPEDCPKVPPDDELNRLPPD